MSTDVMKALRFAKSGRTDAFSRRSNTTYTEGHGEEQAYRSAEHARGHPPSHQSAIVLRTFLHEVRGQPFPRCEQFLFVHDVVAIKHRARFVSRKQHRDAFWRAGSDQVSRRGAPTIVEDPMRDLGLATCIAERSAPNAYCDSVTAKYTRVTRLPQPTASVQYVLQRGRDRQHTPSLGF